MDIVPFGSGDTTAPAASHVLPSGSPPATNGDTGGSSSTPAGDPTGNGGGSFILFLVASLVGHPYATINVKSHVPMTLTMKSTAYSRWVSYFKSMCGKFSLRSHIDGTVAPHPEDPPWDQADC